MNTTTLAHRAALLRADLAMFPAPAALAQALGSDDADGPLTDAADDLRGIRDHLDALCAEHDETYTLYRTTDGRVFDRLGEADDRSVQQDDRSLEVLTVRVAKTRPYVDEPEGEPDVHSPRSSREASE